MIMTCKVLMFKINRKVDMPERIPPTCHYCLVFKLDR